MRDLNNAASKRCRVNRKRKFEVMEVEETQLQSKNVALKAQLEHLERQVARAKRVIMIMVTKKRSDDAAVIVEPQPQLALPSESLSLDVVDFDIDAFMNASIDEHSTN